jgi:DNA modification methylase
MDTYLSLEFSHRDEFPGLGRDLRTPHALVEQFLEAYTEAGDRVLDIFAGFGTTLTVAERLDRVPYGIEYDSDRAAWIRERLSRPENVRHGDVLELDSSWFPAIDCCFTSPPFMEQGDERDPFQNYAGDSTYDDYLDDIESAFARLDAVLAPGGDVVVDVANMKHQGRVTTLAWDVADRISTVFDFDGEVVVTWTSDDPDGDADEPAFGYGYDHSYCLRFTKPPA